MRMLIALLLVAAGCDPADGGGEDAGGASGCGVGGAACGPGEACVGDRCVPRGGAGDAGPDADVHVECAAPCPGGQTCGPGGECVEPVRCEDDEDCMPGRVCHVDSRCTSICNQETCPRAALCLRSRCLAPPACGGDADCPHGTACRGDRCYPPCRSDGDCPGSQSCGGDGACVEASPCRSHRDCAVDRECRDAACVAPVATECAPAAPDDGACEDGVCGPAGRCGPPRVCRSDADCSGGRCSAAGDCLECLDDADCAGAQRCDATDPSLPACVEGERCLADDDCARSRVCAGAGTCAEAPQCEEDALAPNHSAAQAAPIEDLRRTGLARCGGLDDWFRVSVIAGVAVEAVLDDVSGAGLVLELYDEGRLDRPLARSGNAGAAERVGVSGSDATRELLLRVTGGLGVAGPYDLDVRLLSFDTCIDDPAEEWGGDDSPDRATPLVGASGEVVGRRYCQDSDWFTFEIDRVGWFDASITSDAPGFGLGLVGYYADGSRIDPVSPGGPSITLVQLPPGRYHVQVTGAGVTGVSYSMRWQVRTDPTHLRQRCLDAPRIEPGGEWSGRIEAGAVDEMRGACPAEGVTGAEAVARVVVPEDGALAVRVDAADFDPVVYVRRDCASAASEVGCGLGGVHVPEVDPTTWYLVMDSVGPVGGGRFRARVLVGDVDAPGSNDSCENPGVLRVEEDGAFVARGDTSEAGADAPAAPCAPFGATEDSPDAWYLLTTDEDRLLTATLAPDGWDGVLQLYSDSCEADALMACGDEPAHVSVQRLRAGRHYLVVDGFDAADAGPFTLSGTLSDPPDPPANDSCDTATVLEIPEGGGRVDVDGSTLVATPRGWVGCAEAASRLAPELFYRFTLPVRADVRLRVVPHGDFSPAVALRTGGCRDGVEIVCDAGAPWSPLAAGLGPEDYLVVVDGGRPGSSGEFSLSVEVTPVE